MKFRPGRPVIWFAMKMAYGTNRLARAYEGYRDSGQYWKKELVYPVWLVMRALHHVTWLIAFMILVRRIQRGIE